MVFDSIDGWFEKGFRVRQQRAVTTRRDRVRAQCGYRPASNAGVKFSAGAKSQNVRSVIRRAPEVMVKVTGSSSGTRSVKDHLDYISRNGKLELTDENGESIQGRQALFDYRQQLKAAQIPDESKKREFLHVVFSMPAGTPANGTRDAVARFCQEEFANRRYVLALHDDTDHTHVHLCVNTRDIKRAVDSLFELPFEGRRLGVLLQSIPDHGENCLARRLANWCHGDVEGRYAYALDNPRNDFDWETFKRVGFDVTDFLVAGHPATEPILAYLFHLKTLMQRENGGLLATVVEEFWLPLKYPTTAEQILDTLKTGRRRDEFIVLVTQSPEDAIDSPLLPAILQQTPTKIYLPNPDAEFTTPTGGGYSRFGLTRKEFQKLRTLGLQIRCSSGYSRLPWKPA
jgi:hypothetical protein